MVDTYAGRGTPVEQGTARSEHTPARTRAKEIDLSTTGRSPPPSSCALTIAGV
jgi:hypothetical protein